MGLKKLFKPPKEMSREEGKELLQMNGVVTRNDEDSRRKKFKFGEFSKYAKEKTSTQEPLRPRGYEPEVVESTPSSAASYDDPYNPNTQSTVSGESSSSGSRFSTSNSYQQQQQQPYQYNQQHQSEINQQRQQAQQSSAHQLKGFQNSKSSAPSYHTYDPYDQAEDTYSMASRTQTLMHQNGPQERQQEEEQQQQDLDFNSYPDAVSSQQQVYDPYMEQQNIQEEEEIDEEEEEINRIARQTKDVREATVKSTQNILGHLRQADDTATNTIGTLGSQREKMYEIENNLNMMETQQRFVDDHVKDLEHYNRSLFHIKASNPFTKKSRMIAQENKFMTQRLADRERDASLNSSLYQAQNTMIDQLRGPREIGEPHSNLKDQYDYDRRVKEASTYLTEEHDEEDERMEVEYSRNMSEASKLAVNLRKKADVINAEITSQNQGLRNIGEKVNKVDDKIVLTTNRIRGI